MQLAEILSLRQNQDIEAQPQHVLADGVFQCRPGLRDLLLFRGDRLLDLRLPGGQEDVRRGPIDAQQRLRADQTGRGDRDRQHSEEKVQFPMRNLAAESGARRS